MVINGHQWSSGSEDERTSIQPLAWLMREAISGHQW
jgi:hypothetical protein